MTEPRKNPDELGALWEKSNERGRYMTGTINGQKVVVFPNTHKSKETQPDWRVLKSKPRGRENVDDESDRPIEDRQINDDPKPSRPPNWARRRQEDVDGL